MNGHEVFGQILKMALRVIANFFYTRKVGLGTLEESCCSFKFSLSHLQEAPHELAVLAGTKGFDDKDSLGW